MRNIKHHTIIVTSHDQKTLQEIRNKLVELVKSNVEASNGSRIIGELVESLINNFYTLVVYPDGSKEGHETSDDADILRKKIVEYLTSFNQQHPERTVNFIEVFFGSDDGKAGMLNHG